VFDEKTSKWITLCPFTATVYYKEEEHLEGIAKYVSDKRYLYAMSSLPHRRDYLEEGSHGKYFILNDICLSLVCPKADPEKVKRYMKAKN